MTTQKHYRYRLLTAALLVFAVGGIAGAVPPGQPFQERSLGLGSQFVIVPIQCGTGFHPSCAAEDVFTAPLERPYLLHYVALTGSANTECSFQAAISRPDTNPFRVLRLSLFGKWYPPGLPMSSVLKSDNAVLTFPVPLRGKAGDTLGVFRFASGDPSTNPDEGPVCFVYATFGIEYLSAGQHGWRP
jgi:hypothetical protein